jgi:LysM repeat protein
MKRIFIFAVISGLWAAPSAWAADAATEERLNQLAGQIDNLTESQKSMRDQITALSREIQSLRDDQGKPTSYAGRDELNRLAEAIKEVDRKRIEDAEKTHDQLVNLGKVVSAPTHPKQSHTAQTSTEKPAPTVSDNGFEYTIKSGDTLAVVVQGCREKGIKVTVDQILQANPGLKPDKLKVNQKIFIPGPKS